MPPRECKAIRTWNRPRHDWVPVQPRLGMLLHNFVCQLPTPPNHRNRYSISSYESSPNGTTATKVFSGSPTACASSQQSEFFTCLVDALIYPDWIAPCWRRSGQQGAQGRLQATESSLKTVYVHRRWLPFISVRTASPLYERDWLDS